MTTNSGSGLDGMAGFLILVGIATTIFWMVVGWRAMRAHERIAEASEKTAGIPQKPKAIEVEPESLCVSCDKTIPAGAKVCPACGWTKPNWRI